MSLCQLQGGGGGSLRGPPTPPPGTRLWLPGGPTRSWFLRSKLFQAYCGAGEPSFDWQLSWMLPPITVSPWMPQSGLEGGTV